MDLLDHYNSAFVYIFLGSYYQFFLKNFDVKIVDDVNPPDWYQFFVALLRNPVVLSRRKRLEKKDMI